MQCLHQIKFFKIKIVVFSLFWQNSVKGGYCTSIESKPRNGCMQDDLWEVRWLWWLLYKDVDIDDDDVFGMCRWWWFLYKKKRCRWWWFLNKKKDIDDDDSSIKRCRCPHSAGVLTDQVRPRLSHRLGPGYPSSSSSSSSSSLSLSITIESHGFIETNWSWYMASESVNGNCRRYTLKVLGYANI